MYILADTQFVVWDCWDKEDNFITADQVEGDTKIVLFHGTVDRCETDLGFRLPSDVKITKFDGYDMGLLGDIHKRQHLNKEETISYCGSLVQQNHGEGLDHAIYYGMYLKENLHIFQFIMITDITQWISQRVRFQM